MADQPQPVHPIAQACIAAAAKHPAVTSLANHPVGQAVIKQLTPNAGVGKQLIANFGDDAIFALQKLLK